ncbi:MAG: LysM peptidoglycan-binding domain-containing protein [Myxococcota bacterium]
MSLRLETLRFRSSPSDFVIVRNADLQGRSSGQALPEAWKRLSGLQAAWQVELAYQRDWRFRERLEQFVLNDGHPPTSACHLRSPWATPGQWRRYLGQDAFSDHMPPFLVFEDQSRPPTLKVAQTEPVEEPAEQQTTFFALQVVHRRTGVGVAGVSLELTLSDGRVQSVQTDADGKVRIDGIRGGSCAVRGAHEGVTMASALVRTSGPPPDEALDDEKPGGDAPALISVVPHRVRTGETLDGIAESHGLTAERLAEFNWGTTDEDIVQERLREEVGCVDLDDDGAPALTDRADPGVLWIPRDLALHGLSTGREHVWPVQPAKPLYVSLITEDGLPIGGTAFEIDFENGSTQRGMLGPRGVGYVMDPPPGWYLVRYPDRDDIFIKGVAAQLRYDFGQEQRGSIIDLLSMRPELVQAVQGAYDRDYNDFSGEGLVEDIRLTVADDEELGLVRHLLAEAGLERGGGAA